MEGTKTFKIKSCIGGRKTAVIVDNFRIGTLKKTFETKQGSLKNGPTKIIYNDADF
jgi:hypothetical protein